MNRMIDDEIEQRNDGPIAAKNISHYACRSVAIVYCGWQPVV
ncbi:MAG: hypothetical protein OEV42_09880 [Deltaproteobacteria bacterium]|nr:hypothetical protein [Deltaproteobacteria bacterium]